MAATQVGGRPGEAQGRPSAEKRRRGIWGKMKKRRELLLGALTVLVTVVICLLIAEVMLRFLPVSSGMRTVEVTAQSPVFHFTPNRDFVFSRDWDMAEANRGHVNNAGFVNDQDYHQ